MCSLIVAFALMVMVQSILDPNTPFFLQLARAKTIVFPIVAAFLLMLPVVIRDLTKMTNRFTGPVFRLRRAMRDLKEGKFHGELSFRDNDYWQEMAEEFNQIAKQMETWKQQALRKDDGALVGSSAGDS